MSDDLDIDSDIARMVDIRNKRRTLGWSYYTKDITTIPRTREEKLARQRQRQAIYLANVKARKAR